MISRIIEYFPDWVKGKASDKAYAARPLTQEIIEAYDESRINHPHESLCNAPFSNMYFGHRGHVTACCYNRTHTLGTYPRQSVKEIWTSSKAEELRDMLSKNDLSSGCESCEKLLLSKNFDAVIAKNYDLLPYSKDYPTKLEFELDNTCNLECSMCFGEFSSSIRKNRDKKQPLLSPYDDSFVDQLEEFIPTLHSARFFGGEPFLIDIYYKIWDKIVELNPGCEIVVQTNATILNNRVRQLLSRGKFKINISIDSLDKETYEAIRVNASFENVISNINYFHQYSIKRGRTIGLSVCPMTTNWKELPAFINYSNEMDAHIYFNMVTFPEHLSIGKLKSGDLQEVMGFLEKHDFPVDTTLERSNRQHYFDFLKQVQSWCKLALTTEKRQHNSFVSNGELARHLEALNTDMLKNVFYRKIEQSYKRLRSEDIDRDKVLKEYFAKTNKVFDRFDQSLPLKKAIYSLTERDSFDEILDVLKNESEEQIYSRVSSLVEANNKDW